MLKKIGIGLVVVIALIVIISFLLPNNVTVERSVIVNAPIEIVYRQVNDFHNWEKWSPWMEKDPDMEIEYFGSEKGKGSKYCWVGDPESVGKGCLSIVDEEENTSIKTLLEFEGTSPGNGNWTFEKISDGVKVTWAMESDMSEPIIVGKYFGLLMDGLIGPDFEKGLSNIKNIVESMPAYSIEISEGQEEAMQYVYMREKGSSADIGPKMDSIANEMLSFIKARNLEMGEKVFAIWHVNDMENDYYEFSFAFEVSGAEEIDDEKVKFGTMENFKAVKGVHMGAYNNMEGSYGEMMKYIEDKGYPLDKEWMEFYITDPMEQPDTSQWITHIVYPIS
jgi:effector-binding domain-containing protein